MELIVKMINRSLAKELRLIFLLKLMSKLFI